MPQIFELEALEPRVLLSADPLAAGGTSYTSPTDPITQIVVAQDDQTAQTTNPAAIPLAYDPASQIDDIFGGGESGATSSTDDPSLDPFGVPPSGDSDTDPAGSTDTIQDSTESVAEGDASSSVIDDFSLTDPDSWQARFDSPKSMVEMLTETLNSANGPPGLDIESLDFYSPGHSPGTMNLAPSSGIHTWTPAAENHWEDNDADASA